MTKQNLLVRKQRKKKAQIKAQKKADLTLQTKTNH
ncbi:hypothetical protein EVA_16890 [gut metagenome]|uniref:Uncharacterized protein n=1 Tax=gut metagenome TaxID=749906 RepID=J9FJB5_9ZZZZ